jgi:hypothetical protein
MRPSTFLICSAVLIVAGVLTTLSLTQGQERSPAPSQKIDATSLPPPKQPGRDLAKWSFFNKQIYQNGQRASEWLQRANLGDGRFAHCHVPALHTNLENDTYLRQVGAAFALAKAARYYNDEQAAALARQALLTLLLDTGPENPGDPTVRICTLPPGLANRLGTAAALVQAIHELPTPGADLLDQADQLCNFLRKSQRPDGSLVCSEGGDDIDAINWYSGEALYALMRSQQHRPAPWKLEVIRKAVPYYQARWRAAKNLVMVPGHTAGCVEAYLLTKDKALADFVFEMNDWLCTFQYAQLDPLHPLWVGGFMSCVDGKPVPQPPQVVTAAYAQSLAEAARVARQVGDVPRWQRYKDSLERALQFLMTLQYTEGNCWHFVESYRPVLVGAFHASHQDGNLRLDYTQQAVCAMVAYLTQVAEVP